MSKKNTAVTSPPHRKTQNIVAETSPHQGKTQKIMAVTGPLHDVSQQVATCLRYHLWETPCRPRLTNEKLRLQLADLQSDMAGRAAQGARV